jgi:glycosyltransferase involved in cell wall biosynthesis
VEVLAHRDDVPELLAASALTLNPLTGIRGSAVKIAESLAAGRVCVSTEDGARGFAETPPTALLVVPDVAAMAAPIVRLLTQPATRHAMETPDPEALARHSWQHGAGVLANLYRDLLRQR